MEIAGSGIKLANSVPSDTSMALYNDSGTLKWNGAALAMGSSVSGTIGYVPKFTASNALGNSVIYESGGNVGIGTTAPNTLLYVNGVAKANILLANTWLSAPSVNAGYIGASQNLSLWSGDSANIIFGPYNTEKMRITSTGNVGIGTTAPGAVLDVAGGIKSSTVIAAPQFELNGNYILLSGSGQKIWASRLYSAGYDYSFTSWYNLSEVYNLTIKNNGNVGIGTTNPGTKLEVKGASNGVALSLLESSSTKAVEIGVYQGGGFIQAFDRTNNAVFPYYFAGNTIGFVTGTGADGAHPTTNTRMSIDSSGNVGIGTTAPGQQLELTESLKIPTTDSSTSGVIYKGASRFIHNYQIPSTDGLNTFVGINSGNFSLSGAALWDASYNTGMGYGTLSSLTSGYGHTAIGSRALINQTSGYYNTAIGYRALTSSGGSSENTAMGAGALNANIASYNSAFGSNALGGNTTGTHNTGFGWNALMFNKSGLYNTAFGTEAGKGTSNESFYRNSLFGYRAGYGLSTGSNNILIGYQVADNLATGSNNIVIGYDVDVPNVAGSNQMVLGNANTLYGDLANNRVGIGTTNPGYKLDIVGGSIRIASNGEYVYKSYAGDGNLLVGNNSGPTYLMGVGVRGSGTASYLDFGRTSSAGTLVANGMTLDSSGNVGIGTTAPGAKLEVVGGSIFVTGDSGALPVSSGAGFVLKYTSGGYASMFGYDYSIPGAKNLVLQQYGGNVGIGTTAPGYKLDVAGNVNIGSYLLMDSQNILKHVSNYTTLVSSNTGMRIQSLDGNTDFVTVLNSSGNVGIGTTAPGSGSVDNIKLDVVGTQNNGAIAYRVKNLSTSNGYAIADMSSDISQMKFGVGGTGSTPFGFSEGAGFLGMATNHSLTFATNNTVRMSILNTGNVGIGTTGPLYKLDVLGSGSSNLFEVGVSGVTNGFTISSSSNAMTYDFRGSDNVSKVRILDSGNVGIGTTGPTNALDVNGGLRVMGGTSGTAIGAGAEISYVGGTAYYQAYDRAGSAFLPVVLKGSYASLWSSGTEVLRATSGNVGIGTTGPAYALDVNGIINGNSYVQGAIFKASGLTPSYRLTDTGSGQSYYIRNNGNFDIYNVTSGVGMTMNSTGNVGIGTTNPGTKLDVVGDLTVTGVAGTYIKTDFGTNSMKWVSTNNAYVTNIDMIRNAIFSNNSGVASSLKLFSEADYGLTSVLRGGGIILNGTSNGNDGSISFYSSNSQKAIITSGGNVGIGTTAPAYKLDVVGDLRAGATSTFAGRVGIGTTTPSVELDIVGTMSAAVVNANAGNTKLGSFGGFNGLYTAYADMGFSHYSGAAYRTDMVIKGDSGNVGIGTTAPGGSLDIYGMTGIKKRLGVFTDNGTDDAQLLMAYGKETRPAYSFISDNDTGMFDVPGTSDNLAFATVGVERLRINNSGNVGIGTTGQDTRFVVRGNDLYAGMAVENANALGYAGLEMRAAAGGTANWKTFFGYSNANDHFRINANNIPIYLMVSGNEKLTIATSGNVGIGTTAPGAKLDVLSGGVASDVLKAIASTGSGYGKLRQDSSNSIALYLANSAGTLIDYINPAGDSYLNGGNVGIGTTSPRTSLEVSGSIAASGSLAIRGIDAGWWINTADLSLSSGSNGNLIFKNGSTERMRINNSGNVGIGTTSPLNKLAISNAGGKGLEFNPDFGGASYMQAYDRSVSAYSPLIIEAATTSIMLGNIGIGTTAPANKLVVIGDAVIGSQTITVTTGNESLYLANNAGDAKNSFRIDAYLNDLAIVGNSDTGSAAGTSISFRTAAAGAGESNRMTIGPGGSVMIYNLAGSGNRAVYSDANGNLTNSASDIRLKKNIENLSSGLDVIGSLKKLRGIYYNWDTSIDVANGLGDQREIGMAAQEVQAVMPELVGENASGYLSLDYPKMTAYLVEVAKAQQNEIDGLKLTLSPEGAFSNASSTLATAGGGGLFGWLVKSLNVLGLVVKDGVASLSEVVANKFTAQQASIDQIQNKQIQTEQVNAQQITSNQMCVKDSGNNDICLTGDQLKELIQKAGSPVTITQTFAPNPETATTTEPALNGEEIEKIADNIIKTSTTTTEEIRQ